MVGKVLDLDNPAYTAGQVKLIRAGGVLGQVGPLHRHLDGALQHGFLQVMATALPGVATEIHAGGREGPLPAPGAAGVRVLARQCPGQLHPPCRRSASRCAWTTSTMPPA